jgi:hypothetical protein
VVECASTLRWRGCKAGDGALVQCKEGMAGGRAGGQCSGSSAIVEHVALAQGTRGASGNGVFERLVKTTAK